ncbi:hypothetical protein CFP56_010011 [Quercus suber]|uniref:Uncharacterized protein n=1 Tax=Quercus suber TaxID=58331 RepID=A0AAW0L3G0_QUESU
MFVMFNIFSLIYICLNSIISSTSFSSQIAQNLCFF